MLSDALLRNLNICGLSDDSRRVKPGDLFFSFPVENNESFAKTAFLKGAVAIVSEIDAPAEMTSKWIQVKNVKEARLKAASYFYGNPFSKIKVHAVTGTNGKTTSVFLMEAMLTAGGRKTALIGTIHNKIGNEIEPSSLTTPGLLDLFAFAKKAVDANCSDLVMEVSSHALHQDRIAGILFQTALFSNLTQDHLDYHETMSNYFEAKKKLFTTYLAKDSFSVINIDDQYGESLFNSLNGKKVAVSRLKRQGVDIYPTEEVINTEKGMSIKVSTISDEPFTTNLCGEFNIDNVLLVLGFALALRLPESAMRIALETVRVHGRFEIVYNENQKHVVVDYAHTPDALERVLTTARELCKGQLAVLFGCGGDRDKTKRPLMGAIAATHADVVWVTSDNPRTEVASEIIKDIMAGIDKKENAFLMENRAEAIAIACSSMRENDWLVIAGKGHETYQIIGTKKHHFDDSEEVQKAMSL